MWTLTGDTLHRITVKPGVSDGETTEIADGALDVGQTVLVELTPEGRKAYGIGH